MSPEEPAGLDLERRENRFAILPGDLGEVERRLLEEARLVEYPESPITRTIYLAGEMGRLPVRITLKARTYAPSRLDAVWPIAPEEEFNLLEVKRTVSEAPEGSPGPPLAGVAIPVRYQQAWRLVSLPRVHFPGWEKEKVRSGRIRLREILEVLRAPAGERPAGVIPAFLDRYLDESPRSWSPLVGTEYRRRHFVREGPTGEALFRATLDERIAFYSFRPLGTGYLGVPLGEEEAASLEFKVAPGCPAEISGSLEGLVREFLLFPVPSKKYRALNAHFRWAIDRLGLFNEIPDAVLDAVVEGAANGPREVEDLMARLDLGHGPYRLLGDEPLVVERHRSEVEGLYEGLRVRFTGREIRWELPPRTRRAGPAILSRSDRTPLGRMGIESREDLATTADISPAALDAVYRRTRGVLVERTESGRVYLASIGRENRTLAPARRHASAAYLGRVGRHPKLESERPIEVDLVDLAKRLAEA